MAATNLQTCRLPAFGKRLLAHICSRQSSPLALSLVRSVHNSVYDKNQEETEGPIVVPDHVIPAQPVEYWAPHPQTGVFGPASDERKGSGEDRGSSNEGSVLQQTAFFRPLEDLDKPPVELHNQAQAESK